MLPSKAVAAPTLPRCIYVHCTVYTLIIYICKDHCVYCYVVARLYESSVYMQQKRTKIKLNVLFLFLPTLCELSHGITIILLIQDAAKVCLELKQEDTFDSCSGYVSDSTFNELCLMSVCQCKSDYSSCICSALTQYSRLCVSRGAKMLNWRSDQYCGE